MQQCSHYGWTNIELEASVARAYTYSQLYRISPVQPSFVAIHSFGMNDQAKIRSLETAVATVANSQQADLEEHEGEHVYEACVKTHALHWLLFVYIDHEISQRSSNAVVAVALQVPNISMTVMGKHETSGQNTTSAMIRRQRQGLANYRISKLSSCQEMADSGWQRAQSPGGHFFFAVLR